MNHQISDEVFQKIKTLVNDLSDCDNALYNNEEGETVCCGVGVTISGLNKEIIHKPDCMVTLAQQVKIELDKIP
jgi:hypothetical protein